MKKYQYLILIGRDAAGAPGGVVWFSNGATPLGPQLPEVLNRLGQEGWEAVAIGDLAFNGRPEILLKRSCRRADERVCPPAMIEGGSRTA
jgi:hypothetical protein